VGRGTLTTGTRTLNEFGITNSSTPYQTGARGLPLDCRTRGRGADCIIEKTEGLAGLALAKSRPNLPFLRPGKKSMMEKSKEAISTDSKDFREIKISAPSTFRGWLLTNVLTFVLIHYFLWGPVALLVLGAC
jgi:hypothetical protein